MKQLTHREVKALFPSAIERTYPKGQIIFYPGDKPRHVYFLLTGTVKYYDVNDNGGEKIIHLLGAGNFMPILYSFDNVSEIVAFYGSLNEVEVMMIPKKDFLDRLQTNIKLANKVLFGLMAETKEIIQHTNSMSKTDARSKVLYVLGYLLNKHSSFCTKNWSRVNFPINQQIIADLAGLTRETVSGIMQEFETNKAVRTPQLTVLDINSNKLAGL